MTGASCGDAPGALDLVCLDQDHPGFRDPDYRARRNAIARLALDYVPGRPVGPVAYTPEEHDVWATVWSHLDPLHARYACRAYVEASTELRLARERIPQLCDLNPALERATGFRMWPVAGLVSPRAFMSHLDDGVFLATQYIRHFSRPLYTPEPDVVHELVGHAPTFVHPTFTALSRLFGRASKRADEQQIEHLIRLYWYTLEFGVIEEDGVLKVVGAGLLSSFGELGRFEREVRLCPLDTGRIAETPFDPTSYQETLFVAPSLEAMADSVRAWVEDRGL
jgi:phenylalanine-4-hydroxylase